ncbi:MAG: large conductance mechanosensitive channel protein MscL [Robiginitomaculum sp.]|nr:MAG: large conductance mechanosensitive channel protein MscL [Robiginitomaculum sp.]PHQ68471.1 MAG: large conductance mechanosensitive channel protein MscL [Robiginitomaculum sp.]PHS75899.1 MAG: large conductance mechanosensitive channel protein MscL [Robiginitomaculum sp.]
MGMISEFKSFAMKGNLVDMAVGVVMGAAFGTVVKSFIDDVFMPAISPIMNGVDVGSWAITMGTAEDAAVINIGTFINATISFIIVAFVMFMIIKAMNKAKKKEEAAPSAPPAQEVLLAEIRDLLKK